jgi:hypothetical protein
MSGPMFKPLRTGFWFNDNPERLRINAALEAATDADLGISALSLQLAQLRKLVAAQGETLAQLGVASHVMAQMLSEAGLLDTELLEDRITAEVARMRADAAPPQAAVAAAHPYRGGTGAPPSPPATTTCVRCSREVQLAETMISETGNVCSTCYVPPI